MVLSGVQPDSQGEVSPALRAEIASRVYFYAPGIVYVKDVPNCTVASLKVLFARFFEVVHGHRDLKLLVDLTEAARPNAEQRELLRGFGAAVAAHASRTAFVTGRNTLINTALKFVLHGAWSNFSIVRNLEDALAALGHDRVN